MSFFLLLSLFCCDIRNTNMVLFLWHIFDTFMLLIKMYLHGQLLPIRFMRDVCAYVKYEFHRINAPSNTCDWSIKYWMGIELALNSHICVWNRFMENNESKFDVIQCSRRCVFTVCDTSCIFILKFVYSIRIYVIMCMYCYCSTKSLCWILLVC